MSPCRVCQLHHRRLRALARSLDSKAEVADYTDANLEWMRAVTQLLEEAWQQAELAQGAALGTVKKLTDHLRAIFNYAVRTKLIPDAARPYTETLHVDNVRKHFCTPEETAQLIACAPRGGGTGRGGRD